MKKNLLWNGVAFLPITVLIVLALLWWVSAARAQGYCNGIVVIMPNGQPICRPAGQTYQGYGVPQRRYYGDRYGPYYPPWHPGYGWHSRRRQRQEEW